MNNHLKQLLKEANCTGVIKRDGKVYHFSSGELMFVTELQEANPNHDRRGRFARSPDHPLGPKPEPTHPAPVPVPQTTPEQEAAHQRFLDFLRQKPPARGAPHVPHDIENPRFANAAGVPIGNPRTKKDAVKLIAARSGLTQKQTRDVVQQTIDHIKEALLIYRRVELRGFGVLELRARSGRVYKNPRTGIKVYTPPKHVVYFTPGKDLAGKLKEFSEQ